MDNNGRITCRMDDGTAFVQSETGTEGVGYFTTQRRIPDMIVRLAAYEDTGLVPDEIVALKADVERYKRWVDDLQSSMYVNCVYCGHRYGPGETTPVSMADALKQHVENCPKHPMSALKADRDRFKARAEAAEADMKRIADDIYGETDACYPCAICAKNNSRCDTSDNCFEWRGPQEGAAEAKEENDVRQDA